MTFRGFYSDEHGGFRPLRAPLSISKRKKYEVHEGPIYRQN